MEEVEQLWHSVGNPPYDANLFAWLEGKERQAFEQKQPAHFMPMMLSHPIEDDELKALNLSEYQIELKWDGIRIQIVRSGDLAALYSRTGDDISHSFPDMAQNVLEVSEREFVLDGELLTMQEDGIAPFNSLQQRLNRKTVSAAMIKDYPAHVRLYDILIANGKDVRALALSERRALLEKWVTENKPTHMDVSTAYFRCGSCAARKPAP